MSSRGFLVFLALLLIGLAPRARAAAPAIPLPEAPSAWVTDNVGFMSEPVRSSLDRRLSAYAASSGHQILVWIGDTTGDVPLEEFAVRSFEKWKVGGKGIDDGIVLFIFAKDHKVRIEVGYGVEDKVPDAVAIRIIQETIVPRIRDGDRDGAVTSAVEAIVERLEGKLPPAGQPLQEPQQIHLSPVQAIFLGLLLLAFIGFLITHPSLAALLLMSVFSGGRRGGGGFGGGGGGGFGGGGFSGGGGRSGGGGASGSW